MPNYQPQLQQWGSEVVGYGRVGHNSERAPQRTRIRYITVKTDIFTFMKVIMDKGSKKYIPI